jgi:hypothetical protein
LRFDPTFSFVSMSVERREICVCGAIPTAATTRDRHCGRLAASVDAEVDRIGSSGRIAI